ncbi:MAG: hypothetical protein RBS49_02635 [Sphaerochaeta sp.]|jgi:hypothetical protein|nr:hypothetical protein [Sphaerochaeta sp.]
MRRLLPILLAIALLFVSCSSFELFVRSQVEGLPSWVYNPQVRGGQVAYVGKGSSTVAYNARLAAYEDILDQISAYVGEDVRTAYYRELTTTSRIADFNLSVTSEHQRSEKGISYVYLLARLDAALLSARQTTIYRQTQQRENEIAALIKEADRAYRANDDTQAIASYLTAAAVAARGPVFEKKHESSLLVDRAIAYIKALHLSFRATDPGSATTVVQLRRHRRLLSSRVVNAPIVASFTAYNSLAERYEDRLSFNTASQGSFLFIPHSELLVADGSITFSLDLAQVIESAREYLDPVLLAQVEDALSLVSAAFSYRRTSPLASRPLHVEIQEYAIDGTIQPGTVALSSFVSTLDRYNVEATAVDLDAAEREEQIAELRSRYGADALAYVGSVGVVVEDWASDQAVVVASGRLQLYDLETARLLFDTEDVEAVGSAATLGEARIQAMQRFGTIAASRCAATLFTP